jgi:hypothetical protein
MSNPPDARAPLMRPFVPVLLPCLLVLGAGCTAPAAVEPAEPQGGQVRPTQRGDAPDGPSLASGPNASMGVTKESNATANPEGNRSWSGYDRSFDLLVTDVETPPVIDGSAQLRNCVVLSARTGFEIRDLLATASWTSQSPFTELLHLKAAAMNGSASVEGSSPLTARVPSADVPAGGQAMVHIDLPEGLSAAAVEQQVRLEIRLQHTAPSDLTAHRIGCESSGPRPVPPREGLRSEVGAIAIDA